MDTVTWASNRLHLCNNQYREDAFSRNPKDLTSFSVRPKLNVKPSVMKPAVQVKPGQKRRAERSAVAAVKPLNSASTVLDEPMQETACRDRQVGWTLCSSYVDLTFPYDLPVSMA